MKRTTLIVIVPALVIASGCAVLLACNAVLGIDSAILDSDATASGGQLTCENYCKVVAANCPSPYNEYLPSLDPSIDAAIDMNLCETICRMFPNPGPFYDYPGDAGIATGNTLNCRLWHATAARAEQAPFAHCPHAGPLGYQYCTDPADASNVTAITNFCLLDVSYCNGAGVRVYPTATVNEGDLIPADTQTCVSVLRDADTAADGGFYKYSSDLTMQGDLTMQTRNTLNCRLWHLEFAIQTSGMPGEGPKAHCPHTEYPAVAKCVDSDN